MGFYGYFGEIITLNEGWLVWWRRFITAVILWILFFVGKKIEKVSTRNFIKIVSIGTVLSLHWLLFYGSIKYANVSIALTCLATTGLLSAVIEPFFFAKESILKNCYLAHLH
jgi:drug/metabolite transporter (DMT)-like permease